MLTATLVVVGFMTTVIQWSFDRGFLEYVNVEEQREVNNLALQLEEYYAKHTNWEQLAQDPLQVLRLHALDLPQEKIKHARHDLKERKEIPEWMNHAKGEGDDHRRHPIERIVILDEQGQIFFGKKMNNQLPHLLPLLYQGKQVGSIGIYPPKELSETNQLMFLGKQKVVILSTCIAAILITIIVAMTLAYHLTKPIRKLSHAAQKLIEGNYRVRVTADSSTELNRLAYDFNVLAKTLEENESQRKMWVSDIAHELRTPLTGLKGEIEALQDGIRKPNQRTYDNLHKAVLRLQRLVEDLYDLSRSDLGTFTLVTRSVDLYHIVADEVAAHLAEAEKAGLTLTINRQNISVPILGDTERLQQLISNLLTNSIRYTDRGGNISVTVYAKDAKAILKVEDSAPGVPDEALPMLFNRLFRVEQSRNRTLGGSGLGLAICQQIVQAHNGTITADHSSTGGLKITAQLPVDREQT